MAEYDGHIRINTKLDNTDVVKGVQQMSSQYMRLKNQIEQTEAEIAKLQKEMIQLKDNPVDTKGFDRLKSKISETEDALDSLYEKRGRLEVGLVDGDMAKISTPNRIKEIYARSGEWRKMTEEIGKAEGALEKYNAELKQAVTEESKADNPIFDKKAIQLEKLTGKLNVLKQQLIESEQREKGVYSGFEKIKQALSGLGKQSTKTFKRMNSDVKKTDTALGRFGKRMRGLISSLLIFNVISAAFRKMTQSMREGMKEFAKHNADFNKSMSALKSSLSTLRNSFGSAFAPIIQTAIPYLVKLIEYVTKAVNALGQLFAALTGKKVFYKAIEVQEDYAGALEDTKDAADAAKKSIAPFDELNVQSSNKSGGAGGTSGGGYVEVPIDDKFIKWADKIKDILSKLFAPLKKAWETEGKFVIDSWKYALKEVGNLLSDIGRDFLIVWNQDETIRMLEDVLHIIGDIGLVVGNLARQFDIAWNKNNTGLHILENIRDIFAIIIKNIRDAADYTVDWSDKLDFSPLLEGFEKLTKSLVPFADFVSGTLADFYTEFILPLTKFAVESGIPQLEVILSNFFNNVNWEGLRKALKNLYQALEPYAEGFAQGLIDFFEDLMGVGTTFMNSLADPINDIADALNNGDPESARKWGYALGVFATGITALKVAMAGFTALETLFKLIDKIGAVKAGVAETMTGLGAGLAGLAKGVGYLLKTAGPGMIGEWGLSIESLLEGTILDTSTWEGLPKEINSAINGVIDLVGSGIVGAFGAIGEIITDTFNWDSTTALFESAKENFKKGGLYIIQGIVEGILGAVGIIVEPIGDFFTGVWNALCDVFGIHSPAESMLPIGENILLGIIEGFRGKIGEFAETIREWFDTNVVPWFTSEKWNEILEGVRTAFEEKFSEIKEKLGEKWDEIHKKITDVWKLIQKFFSDKFKDIQKLAEDLGQKFVDFKEKVVGAFNDIKSKIQPIVDWIMDKLSSIGSAISGAVGKVSGWGSSIKSGFTSMFTASYTPTSFSAPSPLSGINLTSLPIPALATGTVIPPGMSQFLAVLGDNNRETEIVSPISYIENAVGKAVDKAMQKYIGGNGAQPVKVLIQGDAERFLEVMIEEDGK